MTTNRFFRLNEYRILWVMVFFDLPTETKKDRKNAASFRKKLLNDGFIMFQYSVYIRFSTSRENADIHTKRIKTALPPLGKVGILQITDKQFGMMEVFHSKKPVKIDIPSLQLEMF